MHEQKSACYVTDATNKSPMTSYKKTWIGHLFIETHWALSCLDNSIWRKRKNWNCSHLLNFIEKVSVFSKLLCHCHLTSEKYIWPLYKNVLNWTWRLCIRDCFTGKAQIQFQYTLEPLPKKGPLQHMYLVNPLTSTAKMRVRGRKKKKKMVSLTKFYWV